MRRPRWPWRARSAPTSSSLADGLRSFAGAGRRMELIADTAAVTIYDDYGHHPTEVRAALDAARQKVGPDRRLWAVFEPHMYSRTALLMDEFATAFTDADEVVIADIFASARHAGGDGLDQRRGAGRRDRAHLRGARHRHRRRRRHHRLRRRSPRRPATRCWSWAPGSRTASRAAWRSGWRSPRDRRPLGRPRRAPGRGVADRLPGRREPRGGLGRQRPAGR